MPLGEPGSTAETSRRAITGLLLIFCGFALIAIAVYRGALHGAFVSDDFGYLVTHPYTAELSVSNLRAILDPFGPARLYAANYAPVHLLLTSIERQIFAEDVLGYHLVNVFIHALNASLLVALLLSSRVPLAGALLGGALFTVHPANVEAVAWVSQLKTNAALAFSLGALLAFPRHALLATLLFALGLLTKTSAFFALPMAAALLWARGGGAAQWRWLVGWALLFGLYAIPQLSSFEHLAQVEVPAYADPWVHARTIAAIGARYLVMAATSYGVSAFQEPEPALSLLDPWWLLGLAAGAVLSWRLWVTLRGRREEAAWWIAAAAAFAPVSQLFPFLNPVADRYLYFVLPGLIGGTLLWCAALRKRVPAAARLAASVAVAALALFFVRQSAPRAALWQNETRLLLDAAEHYPEGGTASFLRARRAAQQGDVATAVAELRRAADRGISSFRVIDGDPGLAPIRQDPAFRALVHELAGRWIEAARRRGASTQPELRMMALAFVERSELDEAEESLERALAAGGPLDAEVRRNLAEVRALQARRDAADEAEGRGADGGP
jgi:tetratricopeptide (TPR) repeat protein